MSRPTTSRPCSRRLRTSASPRWPALPVTRTFMRLASDDQAHHDRPDRRRPEPDGAAAPGAARLRRRWRDNHLSGAGATRSEEHTSELQSLLRISYAVYCLKKKTHELNKVLTAENLV